MKSKIVTILILLLSLSTIAQTSINTDGSGPDESAMLDVKSTDKGFLLPRMNTIQISGISNPADGLMVFNIDSSDFYGFSGSKWIAIWNTGDTLSDWYCGNPIEDSRDGQSYNTVQIGTQCWMAENLNYATGNSWCYDDDPANCNTYGRLYDWATLMNGSASSNGVPSGVQGICPPGWHVPSDAEWCIVTTFIDPTVDCNATGYSGTDAGIKMKSISGWYSNGNGTNSSGFTVLPGGFRDNGGNFSFVEKNAIFWSSTELNTVSAWYRILGYYYDEVDRNTSSKAFGFSVRCVQD